MHVGRPSHFEPPFLRGRRNPVQRAVLLASGLCGFAAAGAWMFLLTGILLVFMLGPEAAVIFAPALFAFAYAVAVSFPLALLSRDNSLEVLETAWWSFLILAVFSYVALMAVAAVGMLSRDIVAVGIGVLVCLGLFAAKHPGIRAGDERLAVCAGVISPLATATATATMFSLFVYWREGTNVLGAYGAFEAIALVGVLSSAFAGASIPRTIILWEKDRIPSSVDFDLSEAPSQHARD